MSNYNRELVLFNAKKELAKRSLWNYCKIMDPKFFKEERKFLKDLANDLWDFWESDSNYLILNCPPRHGKSYMINRFVQYLFGVDPTNRIITASYSDTLSRQMSRGVRNTIAEKKIDEFRLVFSDIFPETKVKYGEAASDIWSLEGSDVVSFLATTPGGASTGIGCSLLLIDDLIKNAYEANNQATKDAHWDWYLNTMMSRIEGKIKVIIVATRWSGDDLSGRVIEWCKENGYAYRHVCYKAIKDESTKEMLCESILSYGKAVMLRKSLSDRIFNANYQQDIISMQDRLYPEFKTYKTLPDGAYIRKAYVDSADKGTDYLAAVAYVEHEGNAFVLDLVYTQESMETTEPLTAALLYNNEVQVATIEGNNGGEGFSRSVKRILKEEYQSTRCRIDTFHQSKNKEARILSNATYVSDNIYFPVGWQHKWKEAYEHLRDFSSVFKANKHDDIADCLTGIAEQLSGQAQPMKSRITKYKGIRI